MQRFPFISEPTTIIDSYGMASDQTLAEILSVLAVQWSPKTVVGKKKRRNKASKLLTSHQRCWLWGRHAVMETLRAARWVPLEVVWDPEFVPHDIRNELRSLVLEHDIPTRQASADEITRVCGAAEHQGLMAKMPDYPYADFAESIKVLPEDAVILVLCGIQDPFNFGSILRSADIFQVSLVVIPNHGQAPVSSHVVRASVGAVNYLEIAQVEDLDVACQQLKAAGVQIVSASEQGTLSPAKISLKGKLAILVGNEGTGVPESLISISDEQVAIPQDGHIESLNAAVAAGILCYEIRRQRQSNAEG